LTGARTGEVIGARWDEINFLEETWTVPAGRMKAGREHCVPRPNRAMAILHGLREVAGEQDGGFIFPGDKPKRPLSNMALLVLLRRMGRGDLTTHGFRPSFRDWAAELYAALTLKPAALARETARIVYISWLAACQENAARDNPAGVGETNKGEQVARRDAAAYPRSRRTVGR